MPIAGSKANVSTDNLNVPVTSSTVVKFEWRRAACGWPRHFRRVAWSLDGGDTGCGRENLLDTRPPCSTCCTGPQLHIYMFTRAGPAMHCAAPPADLSASLQNRARPKRHKKMETISSVFRHSFRRQSITSPNTDIAATATSTIDTNNNSPIIIRKKSCTCCGICGKRLLKLAKWSNYITIPCKSRHVFCKECFNERLKTRQKVLTSLSFDLMWTFPCPGHDECGQEISVDWSRGSRFSRNLVARNMVEEEDVEFILEPENTSEESFDQDTSGQLDLG